MLGSFSSGQFELFDWRMFLPLNVTSRIVCGRGSRAASPTFGQTFGSFFGSLQYFVYMVAWETDTRWVLMPILARSAATTWAVSEPGGVLSATMLTSGPVYMPARVAGLLHQLLGLGDVAASRWSLGTGRARAAGLVEALGRSSGR